MSDPGIIDQCVPAIARSGVCSRFRSSCGFGAITLLSLAVALLAGCGGSSGTAATKLTRAAGSLGTATGKPIKATSADWSTLLRGPSHFGASPVAGPTTATIRWQRNLGGSIVAAPVTAGGVAYVSSTDGILHAIDIKSGRDRWTYNGGGPYGSDLSTAATVLPDGLILWPGPRHMLFALSADGRLRWSIAVTGTPLTPAVDLEMHRLVLADMSGHISAYTLSADDAMPTRIWSRALADVSYGSPAIGSDGTIYETAGDSLFALAASGQQRWEVRTSAAVEVSAALSDDGTVVFGSNDRYEYGVAPNGATRWRYGLNTFTYSSPTTLPGARVVFGTHHGYMTMLDTGNGHLVRRDEVGGLIWTAAAVDSRGDEYFASRSKGGIYGFSPSGKKLFEIPSSSTFDSYPAIAADGTLLVGGDDGLLRAIG